MGKIIILSDSTCDLAPETIKERQIEIIPLHVLFETEEYLDGVEISEADLYRIYNEKGILPKTSAITLGEFMSKMEELVGPEGNDVIYTGIGGKLSSTYQNLFLAKDNMDEEIASHVYPVDSFNLSTGTGLLVLKMCDMRDAGLSAKEIVENINKIVPCVRAQFSVKELTFLHKGGRCSGTAKFFGTLLRLRLILRIKDGKIIADDKIIGKYEKALDYQIKDITDNLKDTDKEYLFITHSAGDDAAKYVVEHLPEEVKKAFKHIYITKAGCVISSHCGEGTLGILYIKNSPIQI